MYDQCYRVPPSAPGDTILSNHDTRIHKCVLLLMLAHTVCLLLIHVFATVSVVYLLVSEEEIDYSFCCGHGVVSFKYRLLVTVNFITSLFTLLTYRYGIILGFMFFT